MQEKVLATIREYGLIRPGQAVVCGVSGGADSVALMHVLYTLAPPVGFTLYAAHLNHGIRGDAAGNDERFVMDLCEFYGLPLYKEKADVPALAHARRQTLEQAGREERYDFFERARVHFGADLVAVAHHMDDQAESVLLHLTRGSGLLGLTGMQPKRGRIIRPLLFVRRYDVEEYLTQESIAYCIDATNLETGGTRNRLRLDVLPYIEKHINPAIVPTLCSTAELLRRDEEYLSGEARAALEAARREGGYDRKRLRALPLPLRSRAIRMALFDAGATADIERVHVDKVGELLSARTGARIHLPNIEAWISYDLVCFGVPDRPEDFSIALRIGGVTDTPMGSFETTITDKVAFEADKNVACLDADKVALESLAVRTREKGDRFFPLSAPGHKKLKEYFIDHKVPRERRSLPPGVPGGEVLFIPGYSISEPAKLTERTRRVLRIQYKPSQEG